MGPNGFPGIVMDEHAPEVHGVLFSSESLDEQWDRLDEFEGDGYERVLTTTKLPDGSSAEAYIYVLRGSVEVPGSGPGAIAMRRGLVLRRAMSTASTNCSADCNPCRFSTTSPCRSSSTTSRRRW